MTDDDCDYGSECTELNFVDFSLLFPADDTDDSQLWSGSMPEDTPPPTSGAGGSPLQAQNVGNDTLIGLMSLAHVATMSGHLGVRKTYDRMFRKFYWPDVKSCATKYCRSCHVCPVEGKPSILPTKAPLKLIQAFEEPLTHSC